MQKRILIWFTVLLATMLLTTSAEAKKLKIVATFSDYAAIAKEIAGDKADVEFLSFGDQDPHFVPPKPSLAKKLQDADMFITTGLDLELWAPTLLDKARNDRIMDGAVGYVTASPGILVLEKHKTISRTEGDIHVMGNPHIQTSAVNWIAISGNILIGLKKNDPENAGFYEQRRNEFVDRIYRALFGDQLVELFGGETLAKMTVAGTIDEFLNKEYQGKKLYDLLGGWMKEMAPLRGAKIIAYHPNWSYFVRDYGLEVADFVEPKPGIPPSARHVQDVVRKIKEQNIKLMLVASYFEKKTPQMIEKRTGIKAVILPLSTGGNPDIPDNFTTMDYWVEKVKQGFGLDVSPEFMSMKEAHRRRAGLSR